MLSKKIIPASGTTKSRRRANTSEANVLASTKLSTGKKGKKETELVFEFSGTINSGAADNASAYELAPIIKVKATGKGKNREPATTKLGAPVSLASEVYTASNNEATLTTPRAKLTASKQEELIVNGALLTAALGRKIDGNNDGQPGGDYIVTISGARVNVGGMPLARVQRQPANVADVIDHLLARAELTELYLTRPRARHPRRA
jgi:hypothetical protein